MIMIGMRRLWNREKYYTRCLCATYFGEEFVWRLGAFLEVVQCRISVNKSPIGGHSCMLAKHLCAAGV